MFSDFSPFIGLLAVLWILIGIPVAVMKKNAAQKQAQKFPAPGRPAESAPRPEQAPAAVPEIRVPLAPTISVTEHDDSIYRGSLNAVTGEGYDPCHEEQLAAIPPREEVFTAPAEVARPGFPLGWTNNDVVRGIVMSEILNRKK